MTKEIRCSRCRKVVQIPNNADNTVYQFKICPQCREYQYKKRHKLSDDDLERIVIKQLINSEEAWHSYRKLVKKNNAKGMPKDKFIADFLENQKVQIASYKRFLQKYKTESLPLHSVDCLKWRGMLSDRSLNTNWQPKNDALMNLWLNHTIKCHDCVSWYKINRENADLLAIPYCEDGVSAKDFEKSLDSFWSEFQKPKDTIDSFLDSMRYDICMECGSRKITLPNGKGVCPICEGEG